MKRQQATSACASLLLSTPSMSRPAASVGFRYSGPIMPHLLSINFCRRAVPVCLALVLVAAARAQQMDVENGPAGKLVSGIDQKMGGADVPAAQRQSALAAAAIARNILVRDRAVATPIGYSVRVNRVYGKTAEWGDFDSGLSFFAGAAGKYFEAGETPSATAFSGPEFGVYLNTILQCPLNEFSPPMRKGQPWQLDGKLTVLMGGRVTGQFRGWNIYDGQCVIFGRGSEPPFIPLTREQYLQLEIADYKERLANLKKEFAGKKLDPAVQAAVDSAYGPLNDAIAQREQQLAGMDEAERKSPAGYDGNKLVSPDDEGASPLSVPNPKFYDRSLPATTIQSVEVHIPFLQTGDVPAWLPAGLPEDWRPASEKIRDGLDWDALAALVR